MHLTVFRNRLNPEHADEYNELAPKINDLATGMPGYVSHKTFMAEDGERVTIVEFADEESHRGWADNPEHRLAMGKGRDRLYLSYDIKVCVVERSSSFNQDG